MPLTTLASPGRAVHLGAVMQEMVKGTNVDLATLSEDTGSVLLSLSWSSPTGLPGGPRTRNRGSL